MYTQVPLLVKIYKLLINEIHGLIEERKEDQDDGDYEEDDEGEYEDEEDALDEDNKDTIEVDENGSETDNINKYLNKYDSKYNYLNKKNLLKNINLIFISKVFEDAFDKDDLGGDDDPDALEDPLNKIDLLVGFNFFE